MASADQGARTLSTCPTLTARRRSGGKRRTKAPAAARSSSADERRTRAEDARSVVECGPGNMVRACRCTITPRAIPSSTPLRNISSDTTTHEWCPSCASVCRISMRKSTTRGALTLDTFSDDVQTRPESVASTPSRPPSRSRVARGDLTSTTWPGRRRCTATAPCAPRCAAAAAGGVDERRSGVGSSGWAGRGRG